MQCLCQCKRTPLSTLTGIVPCAPVGSCLVVFVWSCLVVSTKEWPMDQMCRRIITPRDGCWPSFELVGLGDGYSHVIVKTWRIACFFLAGGARWRVRVFVGCRSLAICRSVCVIWNWTLMAFNGSDSVSFFPYWNRSIFRYSRF